MKITDMTRKLGKVIASIGSYGVMPVQYCGMVCCYRKHCLRRISLLHPMAIFVLEGNKTLFRGEERLSVPAGSMFVLPGQMELSIESEPDGDTGRYLALCLTLREEILARVAVVGQTPGQALAASLDVLRVDVDVPLTMAVGHLLDMAATSPGNERLLSLCLEEVLLLATERTQALPLLWDSASTWRSRVARLIGQDPGREWPVGMVAGKLAVSERNLRRCLELEGVSFRQVLLDVRLSAALSLLQAGRITVGEAAHRCGYNSASRFAARFRARFGASPSDILRYGAVSGQSLAEEGRRSPGAAC